MFIDRQAVPRRQAAAVPVAAGLRGDRAARLVRVLADCAPPYGVSEVERATGLSRGYVSRLLDALADQALVRRGARGLVDHVEWTALLRARADGYDVLRTNQASSYIARRGARSVLTSMAAGEITDPAVITGSFGAVRLAPVAAPTVLMAYTSDPAAIAAAADLLPATEGADVVLLRPADEVVRDRAWEIDGVSVAAPSQLVLDCLAGPGRMPAEGEALLGWMAENERVWRARSLSALAVASASLSPHARSW